MKIGIDARLINETGVGRYIRNLLEHLERIDTHNEYVIFLLPVNFDAFTLPNKRWSKRGVNIRWHSLKEQLLLPFIFMSERLDLLHVPYFSAPILYVGKIVVTIHDLTIMHVQTGKATTLPYPIYKLKHLGYRIVLWFAMKRAIRIISVSKTTKSEIQKYFKIPEDKICVTYEGIEEIFFQRQSQNRAPDNPYFLYVGNVYPHKQSEFLIDCIVKLKQNSLFSKSGAKLIFVGKNDFFYKRLEMTVREKQIDQLVEFRYHVSDLELSNLYSRARGLLFPSGIEGFGLPPLEALASSCPVITMDIPIFEELLGPYAYRLPMDISIWCSHIEDLISEKPHNRADLSQYLSQFSWKRMAEQTLHIYENRPSI